MDAVLKARIDELSKEGPFIQGMLVVTVSFGAALQDAIDASTITEDVAVGLLNTTQALIESVLRQMDGKVLQ